MKGLGNLHFSLGIQFQHTNHGLFLSLFKYVAYLLGRAKMTRAKTTKIPLLSCSKLSQCDSDPIDNMS